MTYNTDSWAILDSCTKMNPAQPQDAEYYDAGQVAYILERESGRRLVATSFGSFNEDLAIGKSQKFHHDQSGRTMGHLRIIGIATFATGATEGEVPDRKLPHFVFK